MDQSAKLCSIFSILVFLAVPAFSQNITGTIAGTVRDETAAVMPGVKITVHNTATGLERSALTGDNGSFRIPALPFGPYGLKAEKQGFQTAVVNDITLAVDQVLGVDVVMKVGTQVQVVTVTGAVEVVNAQTSNLGGVVEHRQVVDLPLNGRDFTQLARLQAGVASSGGGGGQQGGEGGVANFSSNGQRSDSNNFMVDGIDNNNYLSGAVAQLPSIDSIQEFEVQTNNFSAEYGRNSGAVINLVTRSGSNELHGSLFEFLRNSELDARNFFDNSALPKPGLRLNQFGATLGGPLRKNRTFFFLDYEGFRRRAAITRTTNVPTLLERQGIFTDASGKQVQVKLDPVSARMFNLWPLPNLSGPSGNFVSSPSLSTDTDQGLVKVDHHFKNNDSLSARFSRSRIDNFFPFVPGQGGTNVPGFGVIQPGGSNLASVSHTKIFGPRLLNEFRFGFNRTKLFAINEPGPKAADFGINTGHGPNDELNLGNIPNITFSGGFVSGGGRISNLGGTINNPSGAAINTFQWIDHVSYTTARHAWKLGADIRRIQLNRRFDLAFSGQVIFDGSQNPEQLPNALVDFAEGRPSGSLQFVGDSNRSIRTSSYDFFAQDAFKMRPNLILNYGLRYELNTVLHDATGRLSTWYPQNFKTFLSPTASQFDLNALRQSGIVTQDEVEGLYVGDRNNFAPRIGLAYSLGRRARTVIRAGFGVFYDTIIGNIPGNVLLNPPFLPNFFNPAPFIQWPNSFGPTAFPVLTVPEQHLRTPYAMHYNFDIQQELPGKMLFEIAYVGTKGTKLTRFREINQPAITQADIDRLTPPVDVRMQLIGIPPPAIAFLKNNIALQPPIVRVPFFGFVKIFTAESSVNSNYNGLQTKLTKQFGAGLTFLLSYTYSKSIDSASVFFGSGANGTTIFPQNNFNPRAGERGLSDFDIRHRFSGSYIYQLPLKRLLPGSPAVLSDGWELGGILTLQTGQPFSVLTGANNSRTSEGNDRPDLVGDPNSGPRTVQRFFNTDAFRLNKLLTFGNSGRNIVRGPNFRNFDFSVLKNTRIGERFTTQFRAEFFNLTNHPNFALPSNVESAANFGALFQTPDVAQNNVGLGSGGPRLIQFGLKLTF